MESIIEGQQMTDAIIVALITSAVTLIGVITSNNKTNAVIQERIDSLTEKVNKHNNVIERTYKLEERMSVVEEKISVGNHRIDDLESAVQK